MNKIPIKKKKNLQRKLQTSEGAEHFKIKRKNINSPSLFQDLLFSHEPASLSNINKQHQ